jgi:signal transduction histidine kinase/ligand-binding sensor domain-containing protein
MRGWSAALLLGAAATVVPAAEPHFQHLDASRGLVAEELTAVLQDRVGFVWVGSREGLFLYDGHTFTLFDRDVRDPDSLADNSVRTLFEDREGRLWIGTNTGGLEHLDRATWKFRHHRHDPQDAESLSHNSVYAVVQDRDGALWVGTQQGLNKLDPASGRFRRFLADGSPGALGHAYVTALRFDDAGTLWVGTFGGGVFRKKADRDAFESVPGIGDPGMNPLLVRAVVQDRKGGIWTGVIGGLLRFDSAVGAFVPARLTRGDGSTWTPNGSVALAVAPDGTLWGALPGTGALEIDPGRLSVRTHGPAREGKGGLSTDNAQGVHVSRDGTVWIATYGGGLNLLGPVAAPFTTRIPDLHGGSLSAVTEDAGGVLWMGTQGEGILRVDPEGGRLRSIAGSRAVVDQTILAVAAARSGGLWATTPGSLLRLDASGRTLRRYAHDPEDPASLGPGFVTAVHEDVWGRVWVGTGEGGLHRLGDDGHRFDAYRPIPGDAASLSDSYVAALGETRDGTLWVGTRSGGLNALPPGGTRFTRYLPDPLDPLRLAHHHVTSLLEDADGRLWIGTMGGGLHVLDRTSGRFRRYGEREGLVDDNVSSILADDDGTLWIATRHGLARFDPRQEVFVTWGTDDGLPGEAFASGAAWRGRRLLHFCGTKGLVSVPRGTPFPNRAASPVVLTSLRTLAGPVRADLPVWELSDIELRYGEVLFADFAVLDFRGRERHRFQYQLGGGADSWIDIGDRRSLTVTGLEPGVHALRIRGRNADGVWAETARPIRVEVIPPFWRTGVFRAGALLALLGIAFGWHRARTRGLERRNLELVRLRTQREEAYDRLRALTRRLDAAKEEERRRIAIELHDEMGQALTAAKINLQLAHALPDGAERTEKIVDTVGVIDRLLHHVRELSLDLRPPLLDDFGLVPALRVYLEAQSRRSGVEFLLHEEPSLPPLPLEVAIALFRVVQEATNNVVRHAGASSAVVRLRREGAGIEVTVRDDGSGFSVPDTMERAARGGHLGLLGITERVQALGGDAVVDSSPGGGTAVSVQVPLAVREVA